MSGLEALYWAQKYPDEVEAIIGLDMAVPDHYDEMNISIPTITLGQYGAKLGITRWIPSLSESDAVKFGNPLFCKQNRGVVIYQLKTVSISRNDISRHFCRFRQISIYSNHNPAAQPLDRFVSPP